MFDLIRGFAAADDRIRAVYMNGSRANPSAPRDEYRDYDIVFTVTETRTFIENKDWIKKFGTPLIIQEPDWNDIQINIGGGQKNIYDFNRRYAWLMLFDDGVRIDLGIEIAEETRANYLDDKLTVALLDKDGILPDIPPPTDIDYRVRRPVENEFLACCNEFWWCLNNVAKGVARDELPYAMEMYGNPVREALNMMVEWHIGINTDFRVSAGKMGKYFKKYLAPELYEKYAATYTRADYGEMWDGIYTMCGLFRELAIGVADRLGFTYREREENGMLKYFEMVRAGIKNSAGR